MPELPEVETTRRGIAPHIHGQRITAMDIRQPKLRWPIPAHLPQTVQGLTVLATKRRAKYLLLELGHAASSQAAESLLGTLIIHLGMSGSLRILQGEPQPPAKHEHFDIRFGHTCLLRFTDPRRFGACLWMPHDESLAILDNLGPEPLASVFDAEYLFQKSRKRVVNIKSFVMDQKVVVGVGNIYASECLYLSGINPKKAAGKVSKAKFTALVEAIKLVLKKAIDEGGTTLKDFVGSDGKPGYFAQQLNVYGRTGAPCPACQQSIKKISQGQRSTFYCSNCQK
ncbi:MAG: bifunctional DNA-formamidopyrimidine glycosylase/DNA-(apurinic or apyrimidinic site) lyase [Bermanella sp.]|jgi:DNA-(apurinic or apyrimidinic site) lyase (EC 4.2.99.18)/Formamidopyrimidine-DNA glycosylase (EC 3.2.2.23)